MLAVALALGDVDPARRVAGLPLLLRTALELQRSGASRIVVGSEPRHREAVKRALDDPRLTVPWHLVVAEPHALLEALRAEVSGPVLFGRHDMVVDAATYRQARDLDDVHVPNLDQAGWHVCIAGEHDIPRASTALFEACRKPVDGIVSRHINRHLSLWLSRRLVDTPVTPNTMTLVVFTVSVSAAWLALDPSYATTAAAGALMQLGSVLDGCDGELARVRHEGTKLGQWLDTVVDDVTNVLFWAALGYGASKLPGPGRWLALGGYTAAAANAAAAAVNYVALARKGSGDFYALLSKPRKGAGPVARVIAVISLLLKQDFFLLLVMLLALAGLLHWTTPLLALGAIITFGAALVRLATQPKSK